MPATAETNAATEADRTAALACADEACRNMSGLLDLNAMTRHFAAYRRAAIAKASPTMAREVAGG